MAKKKSPKDLSQSMDTWYFAIRKMNTWTNTEEGETIRPFAMVSINLDQGFVQDIRLDGEINETKAKDFLLSAMLNSPEGMKIEPQRPARVFFEDRNLEQALYPDLQKLGVESKFRPQTEMIDMLFDELHSYMNEEQPQPPGLLSMKKVNPKMIEKLFSAAAAFYRAAPWVQLSNQDVLSVQVTPQKEPYYLIVMGQGGIEYGISLYKQLEDLEQQMAMAGRPEMQIPPHGYHSFSFGDKINIPFHDLDAIETYRWEIAGEWAYPMPIIFTPSGEVQRPDRELILWYEAVLRAIPIFVEKYITQNSEGEIQPVEAAIPIKTSSGSVTVKIVYPVGDLSEIMQSVYQNEEDQEPLAIPFDRRVMEGDLYNVFPSQSGTDSEVDEAQQLMYKAWEEQNPAKRIILAHEALKISADCSDAYVMLAEEQASTLKEALALYKSGVEAGKRALGDEYFEENVGYFWGLLETRPYMRAMEGMASCLWQLNRKTEALETYKKMLHLNPGDNQGIRYILVDLLLNTNHIFELEKLIEQYKDDQSAIWLYTQALLAFRAQGEQPASKRALNSALQENSYVPEYLLGKKRIPNRLPSFISFGDDSEAVGYAANHLNYWRQTPGAVVWLEKEMKTKKGKKKTGDRRNQVQFKVGDTVKVKSGNSDPDLGGDISGWQGRVLEIDDSAENILILIAWDSQTLRKIPGKQIEHCEEEGLDWSEMYLYANDVVPSEPRDTLKERLEVFNQLSFQYEWAHLGEQGRRIQSVLEGVDPEDEMAEIEAWQVYLSQQLRIPFDATVSESQRLSALRVGNKVKVINVQEMDDLYGIIAKVTKAKKHYHIPLCDLETVSERSKNHQLLSDYTTWFVNK